MSDVQADAITLWCAHSHAHEAADVSPKLVLKSVQKRSGKTRLATALARLVHRPLYVSGIKPAALLRIVETCCPTLLLDEIDAAMKGDREMAETLRGIINSGFDRAGARYIMNVPVPGGGYEPRQFSTWAPQLLSGIGALPETVRDRAIEIEMLRKRPEEKVLPLRRRDGGDLNVLCRKLARWAQDNMEKLPDANPAIPPGLDDRAADAWEPLLAFADLVGGDWPERARRAALELSGEHVKRMTKSEQFCSGTSVTYLKVPTTIFTRPKRGTSTSSLKISLRSLSPAKIGHGRSLVTPENRLLPTG